MKAERGTEAEAKTLLQRIGQSPNRQALKERVKSG